MTLFSILLLGVLGAAICWGLIPHIQKLSLGMAVYRAQFHHTHARPVPRLGGLALCAAFSGVVGISFLLYPEGLDWNQPHLALTLSSLAMFALGFLDDLKPLPAKIKLTGQILIAGFAYAGGIRIEILKLPMTGVDYGLHYWSPLATIFWLVALTNLLNIIDGIDGLAAGIGLMLMLLLLPLNGPWLFPLLIATGMAGALLSFLYYNFPPAKIYLGDGGAYFLGFLIGALSIVNSHKGSIAAALVIPLFGLAVPIVDLSLAILRRWAKGLPILRPDRKHIHHHLVKFGFSRRRAVLTLYTVSLVSSFLALALFWSQGRWVPLAAGFLFLALVLYARRLGFVQDWFAAGTPIAQAIELRKETRHANSLTEWLEMEADRSDSLSDLWINFQIVLEKLGFSKVTLTLGDVRQSWEVSRSASRDSHFERHEFPSDRAVLDFYAGRGQVNPWVFEHLTELAAEAWMKALYRWRASHPGELESGRNSLEATRRLREKPSPKL